MKNLVNVMKINTELKSSQVSKKKVYSDLLFDLDESSSVISSESYEKVKVPKQNKIGFG